METTKILHYIDEAVSDFGTIKNIVFTGGECFLIGKDLPLLISHSTLYGLSTRVVSNGYWATSYETAIQRLQLLIKSGLKEINFSTGDNHQKFIPLNNIINGIRAAYDLGVRLICLSIETDSNLKTNNSLNIIHNDPYLQPMIKEGSLFVINGAWMHFKKTEEINVLSTPFHEKMMRQPCENIFSNIFINPHSQLLSCCGITVEFNKFLKLGNLDNNKIKSLYNYQCNDLLKIWLHIDGPAVIYDEVVKSRGLIKKEFNHKCAYCLELIKDEENIKVLRMLIKENLPNIIYKQKMRISNFKY